MCNENSHDHNHIHQHDHEHEHCHNHNHQHGQKEHAHEHTHTHAHDHEHEHCHEHKHECGCETAVGNDSLSKEEKTLKLLLNHWVDHNKSHEEGFKDWVEKSKQMGKIETSDSIRKAIEFMEKADEMLIEAQKHI